MYSALLGIERPDGTAPEHLREPDDVGQRRAQLVGKMVDEVVAQLLGRKQRLVALGQRALDVHARRRVGEGEEGPPRRGAARRCSRRCCHRGSRAAALGRSAYRAAQLPPCATRSRPRDRATASRKAQRPDRCAACRRDRSAAAATGRQRRRSTASAGRRSRKRRRLPSGVSSVSRCTRVCALNCDSRWN